MKPHYLPTLFLAVGCAGLTIAQPVVFDEPNLKTAVEQALSISDPTPEDMLDLTRLYMTNPEFQSDFSANGIETLTGLEHALNLRTLWIRVNLLSDISALSDLTALKTLHLSRNKLTDISSLQGLNILTYLDLHGNRGIDDISPLSGLNRLQTLILRQTNISDLSALSNLIRLKVLHLSNAKIKDISPLSSLIDLEDLIVAHNDISNISALTALQKLESLDLSGNRIQNTRPLFSLVHLKSLNLRLNPLDDSAYASGLQKIKDNNPGLSLLYHPNRQLPKNVSASDGLYTEKIHITWNEVDNGPSYTSYYRVFRASSVDGNKTPLGEWQTALYFDDITAEAGLNYTYWVKTAVSDSGNSEGNYSTPDTGWRCCSVNTIFVDDDAPHDPAPTDPSVSDVNEDGSRHRPFDSIQEAIDIAHDHDTIQVSKGRYYEVINLMGKNIHLTGLDPNSDRIADFPVIDAMGLGPVLTCDHGEDANCVISGFTLTGGIGEKAGAVVSLHSSPVMEHCIIVGNRFTDPNGGAVYLEDSHSVFINCTLTDNAFVFPAGVPLDGATMSLLDSEPTIHNSILWNTLPVEILVLGLSSPTVNDCTVRGGWPGEGNLSSDPLFVTPGLWAHRPDAHHPADPADPKTILWGGDYHLMSEAGRWDPRTTTWVTDDATSPAIDSGDPLGPWTAEPLPNGGRINQGAYGGTPQASKSK